jgi:3-oxoacyl-(acyl-carrier-protein) synthase
MERRLDKSIKFVLVSGKKALADAGLDWQGQDIKVRCRAAAAAAAAVVQTEIVQDACLT